MITTPGVEKRLEPRWIDPIIDPAWSDLIARRPSDVFHSPAWCRVLADTYGFRPVAGVLDGDDGRAVAGIVYADVEDIRGVRRVALPFSDFCDPIADTPDHHQALLRAASVPSRSFQIRCRHDARPHDPRLRIAGRDRWHAVDLPSGLDPLWESIDPGARRSVRKARAGGVTIRRAVDRDDLRRFYQLHLGVRKRKYQLLAQPFAFFEHIWDQFIAKEDGVLLLAMHQGRVVGGVLYLRWRDTLYYKFNASDPDHLVARPNDLLLWSGIELAHQLGLGRVDLGLTDGDQDGLLRYKRKYATAETEILTWRTQGHTPNGSAGFASDLRRVTGLLVDPQVPDEITERGGEVLYRYFA